MIVPLYKCNGEETESKNYEGINMQSVVKKTKFHKVIEGLTDDEEGVSDQGGDVWINSLLIKIV